MDRHACAHGHATVCCTVNNGALSFNVHHSRKSPQTLEYIVSPLSEYVLY